MNSDTIKRNTIIGILSAAKECGITNICRTALIKYLYLLDVYTSEETAGKETWTDFEWKFHHYGPYSAEAVSVIDELVKDKSITLYENNEDRDFFLYSVSETNKIDLNSIKKVPVVKTLLEGNLKKYGNNLPALLDYVYFQTMPMENVNPGDILHFDKCVKMLPTDYLPVELKKISKKQILKIRKKLNESIKNRKKLHYLGAYDEDYEKFDSVTNEQWDPEDGIYVNALIEVNS